MAASSLGTWRIPARATAMPMVVARRTAAQDMEFIQFTRRAIYGCGLPHHQKAARGRGRVPEMLKANALCEAHAVGQDLASREMLVVARHDD